MYEGKYIIDPNQDTARATTIFDASGHLLNPWSIIGGEAKGQYPLIAPQGYNLDQSWQFAQSIKNIEVKSGERAAPEAMAEAYRTDGSHDVQRGFNHGDSNTFVPAYRSIASFDVGFVAAASHISSDFAKDLNKFLPYGPLEPVDITEIGGGWTNLKSWYEQKKNKKPSNDISGKFFNNPNNIPSIEAGNRLGEISFRTYPKPTPLAAPSKSGRNESAVNPIIRLASYGAGSHFDKNVADVLPSFKISSDGAAKEPLHALFKELNSSSHSLDYARDGGSSFQVSTYTVQNQYGRNPETFTIKNPNVESIKAELYKYDGTLPCLDIIYL